MGMGELVLRNVSQVTHPLLNPPLAPVRVSPSKGEEGNRLSENQALCPSSWQERSIFSLPLSMLIMSNTSFLSRT